MNRRDLLRRALGLGAAAAVGAAVLPKQQRVVGKMPELAMGFEQKPGRLHHAGLDIAKLRRAKRVLCRYEYTDMFTVDAERTEISRGINEALRKRYDEQILAALQA